MAATHTLMPRTFRIMTKLYPAKCLATKALQYFIDACRKGDNADIVTIAENLYRQVSTNHDSVAIITWEEMTVWYQAVYSYSSINKEESKITEAMRYYARKHVKDMTAYINDINAFRTACNAQRSVIIYNGYNIGLFQEYDIYLPDMNRYVNQYI